MNSFDLVSFLFVALIVVSQVASTNENGDDPGVKDDAAADISQEQVECAKGSVCGYCTYCKFCKLCEKDCPCETSASKPNCKMCKYCKYCYLCSAVCDTICTPGGLLDRVSASIVNSLPSVDHTEVNSDIESVKPWIDKKKDEL